MIVYSLGGQILAVARPPPEPMRVAAFTWAATAAETVAVYQAVAGEART
jgi:hypothetical protein